MAVLHALFLRLGQAPAAADLARDLPLGDARGKPALARLSAWQFADEWFRTIETRATTPAGRRVASAPPPSQSPSRGHTPSVPSYFAASTSSML